MLSIFQQIKKKKLKHVKRKTLQIIYRAEHKLLGNLQWEVNVKNNFSYEFLVFTAEFPFSYHMVSTPIYDHMKGFS